MKRGFFLSRWLTGFIVLFSLSVVSLVWSLPKVQAAVWYVRQEAPPGGDGTSWLYAFNNIQDAIDAARSDDQIFVRRGTYTLDSTLTIINKGPHLYGGFQGLNTETLPEHANPMDNPTIIDGGNSVRCISISLGAGTVAAPVIDGFIIQNGRAAYEGSLDDYGAGIRIGPYGLATLRPIIRNCIFKNNVAGRGGGAVSVETMSAIFKNCVFWKNSVASQGTTASFGGAVNIVDRTAPTESTLLFTLFTNCVFYDNRAYSGGAIYNGWAQVTLWNSILWGNSASEGPQIYTVGLGSPRETYLQYSNIQGGPAGAHGGYFSSFPDSIISADPRWAGPDVGDFRLRETSPCIDAGGGNIYLPDTDLFGGLRVVDGNEDGTATVDMGVHEFIPGAFAFGVWYVDGSRSSSGDGRSWETAFKKINEAVTAAQSGDQVWIRAGTYEPEDPIMIDRPITLYGGFVGTENSVAQRDLENNPVILRGSPLYSSSPYSTIRFDVASVQAVLDGLTFKEAVYKWGAVSTVPGVLITDCVFEQNVLGVRAGPGTTIRSSRFTGNKRGIEVQWSGDNPVVIDGCLFDGNATDTIDPLDNAGRGAGVFVYYRGHVDIRYSTFRDNQAVYGAAVAAQGGGGDYGATVTLTSCIFGGDSSADGNTATGSGGAVCVQNTDLQVTDCSFRHNSAPSGGGLHGTNSNVNIIGGTFAGNSATNDGGGLFLSRMFGTFAYSITGAAFIGNTAGESGGGAHNADMTNAASFAGCIFTDNTASSGGGGLSGNASVVNSIFKGNSAQWGGGANLSSGNHVVHCVFYENTASSTGGALSTGTVSVANSIFAENYAGSSGEDISGWDYSVSHCRVDQGSLAGTDGNIDDPPQFVDAAAGNFRLQETSPCIDAGTLTPPGGLPPTDIDGNPRPRDGNHDGLARPDMGAYERESKPVKPGDVDGSGEVNLADAITALQVISGNIPSGPVFGAASLSGEGRIGLEEAIYALQRAADMRPPLEPVPSF